MAVEADLSNATAEDLILVMGIVGCKDDELRGDPQKLEAPKLTDIIKLGEALERKTFAEKGFAVKVNAVQASTGAKPKAKRTDDPVWRKEIKRLMKGKCYRCGEGHQTDLNSKGRISQIHSMQQEGTYSQSLLHGDVENVRHSKDKSHLCCSPRYSSPHLRGNDAADKNGADRNLCQHRIKLPALHPDGTSSEQGPS